MTTTPLPPGPSRRFIPGRFSAVLLLLLTAALPPVPAAGTERHFFVEYVIDGDTVVIDTGERVRYIGMDTPEAGEPFYEEARERNRALVGGKKVRLVFCDAERRDKYGRLLAWVYSDGVFVNKRLVEEGLARKFPVPPCGRFRYGEFKKAEDLARARKLGLWSTGAAERRASPKKTITPQEAPSHIGKTVRVRGRVEGVIGKPDGVVLTFEGGGLTAVISPGLLRKLKDSGTDPAGFGGRVVTVRGLVRVYRGAPEILLKRPSDIKAE